MAPILRAIQAAPFPPSCSGHFLLKRVLCAPDVFAGRALILFPPVGARYIVPTSVVAAF